MPEQGEVTQLLVAYREGDSEALERLLPIVYQDLRRIAQSHLRGSRPGQTLNATGLVHEAYLRLVDQTQANWQDQQHFISVCARAMRQIVVSNARKKAAAKRGGGERPATLNEELVGEAAEAERLIALDDALERLGQRSARMAQVVECRYFAGLTEEETAQALDTSLRTVQREWMRAKAWLQEYLS